MSPRRSISSPHGSSMQPLEWMLWLCSALVFAVSSPRAELPLDALQSTEAVASSLHASPSAPAQAGSPGSVADYGGARTIVGIPLPSVHAVPEGPSLRIASVGSPGNRPDTTDLALGFLPERSLAPPRLG